MKRAGGMRRQECRRGRQECVKYRDMVDTLCRDIVDTSERGRGPGEGAGD